MSRTIIFIHGMWTQGRCFDRFQGYFRNLGYETHAPSLKYHEIGPQDPPPPGLATASLTEYTDDLENRVNAIDPDAVLVGHSLGGLLAQQLAARGLGSCTIALTPAPMAGIFAVHPSSFWAFRRIVMNWGFWRKPHKATAEEARWAVFNGEPEEEVQRESSHYVWESGRALAELAFWNLDRRRASAVETAAVKTPIKIFAGTRDRIVPASFSRAAVRRYDGRAEYTEFSDKGHWLIGGREWQRTADRIHEFINRSLR